ncbi:MAG: OmpA family protein [Bacteroidales bacterium]|nr:OmpA family protein [Bacteroidales bacterium]
MKSNLKILLFLLTVLFINISAFSQDVYQITSNSRKAKKHFEKSLDYIRVNDFTRAETEIKKAIKADKKFIEAHMVLGDIYAETQNIEGAIIAYNEAITLSNQTKPSLYFIVANFYIRIGKYADAKRNYQIYLELQRDNRINPEIINSIEKNISICDFAIYAIENPVPFTPINLGVNINTELNEYSPVLTADDQIIIFTKEIHDANQRSRPHEDFFISYKRDSAWMPAVNLGLPINTLQNEGAPTLSPDGKILVFVVCPDYDGYGQNREGYGSCDIFFSRMTGETWTPPKNIGRPINTTAWESHPSFSSDGKTIYFISSRNDGTGGSDIWVSALNDEGYWENPRNIGAPINTSGNEYFVFIHPDNKTLYFSSDGHPGMGGLDIFYARKNDAGEWGQPVNLGFPINTANDESSFFVNATGKYAYFASDRQGGNGGLDLYCFELYEEARPQLVTYLKGIVYDNNTNQKLEAKFELINLRTGLTEIESYSDRINGSFLVCIPTDNDYALNVSKNGYLFYSEHFSVSGSSSDSEPFLKNIPLQPIGIGESIILRNIFFETAKFDLKPESLVELNKLLELLTNNPNMIVEISGHTDNVGGQEYNRILSENRAKAVFNFLVEHQISANRLSYKGYGDTRPIDINTTDEGRANNRRTEFKILSN